MHSMNPIKWLFALFWLTVGPRYFGGDSDSTTETTTQNYDNRTVTTNTTSNLDLSNRSVDSSVNTVNTLDGGAIAAMRDIAMGSLNYGDTLFDKATMSLNSSLSASKSAFETAAGIQRDALLSAKDAYKDSDKNTKSAYETAMNQASAAYADAKGTTNAQKSIIMGVLAVAGLMAMAFMQKRAG